MNYGVVFVSGLGFRRMDHATLNTGVRRYTGSAGFHCMHRS